MDAIRKKALDTFQAAYRTSAACATFAPGFTEILGDQTEYNGGCVLLAPLEAGVAVAAARIPGFTRNIELCREGGEEPRKFPLDSIRSPAGDWTDPVLGAVREADRAGLKLRGTRLAVVSTLPAWVEASCPAALELVVLEVLHEIYGNRPPAPEMKALMCRRAQENFLGGVSSLAAIHAGVFTHSAEVFFIDCSTLRHQVVPLGRDDLRIVLADSGEPAPVHVEGRRACERVTAMFGDLLHDDIRSLRDVSLRQLEEHASEIDEADLRMAEHVIRENERVLRGFAAVKTRQFEELTRLMFESHASSRDLFGNSTPRLDALVETVRTLPGIAGAKLTGGGYGGSTVNLVEDAAMEAFLDRIQENRP